MQRWAYMTRFPARPHTHINEASLNSYGAEGWELVSASPYPRPVNDAIPSANGDHQSGPMLTQFMYIFKRPVAGDGGDTEA
jgi:hypothetical protein